MTKITQKNSKSRVKLNIFSAKCYIKKKNCNNPELNLKKGGKDTAKIKILQIIKYYQRKSLVQPENDFIGDGWFLTSNKTLCEKTDRVTSVVCTKLRELEQDGYIERDVKYILGKDNNLRPYIKIIFTDKLINLWTKKKRPTKLSTKIVDNKDKSTDNSKQNHNNIYIDNKYSINIINTLRKKIQNPTKRLLEIVESELKNIRIINFGFKDIRLDTNICNKLRIITGKYFNNNFFNELIRKLSVIKPLHKFRKFEHFIKYFIKAIHNEKREWRIINKIKNFRINLTDYLENYYKKVRFIDILNKKYLLLNIEFDINKIKSCVYKQANQYFKLLRLKSFIQDLEVKHNIGIIDAIVGEFHDRFKFVSLANNINTTLITLGQTKAYLFENLTPLVEEFEKITKKDY